MEAPFVFRGLGVTESGRSNALIPSDAVVFTQ
jgi:hypothetical protein